MKIRLFAFASASDALGVDELSLDFPSGSRVRDLKARLLARAPALEPLWPRLAIAVDGEVVDEDERLTDGAEVALLPPVSGGRPDASGPTGEAQIFLSEAPLDPAAFYAAVAGPERGAVILFVGTVRDQHQGRTVTALTYHAYSRMAVARLRRIAASLEGFHDGLRIAIGHRLGTLAPGEASVVIATASPHRAAAYVASRTVLERLKAEVPIWKQEHYADGATRWREEESLKPELALEPAARA